jgi:hypothetical protein
MTFTNSYDASMISITITLDHDLIFLAFSLFSERSHQLIVRQADNPVRVLLIPKPVLSFNARKLKAK